MCIWASDTTCLTSGVEIMMVKIGSKGLKTVSEMKYLVKMITNKCDTMPERGTD